MSDVPEGDPTGAAEPTEEVMDLLAEHVPLALLLDLAIPEGPASADLLQSEGMPDDAWWEPEDEPADGSQPGPDPASDPASDPAP